MTVIDAPRPTMTDDERRALIQSAARATYNRKVWMSRVFMVFLGLALIIALIPLLSIIRDVIGNGWRYVNWTFLSTPQAAEVSMFNQNAIGGISNAITGTLLIDAIATLIAIPISILMAISLYESSGRIMNAVRMYVEVMIGLPSILVGIFIYVVVVTPMGYRFTAFAGALALAMMMIPLMTIACESALRAVPETLTEAALALGAKPSRVMLRVVLPYAVPRMITGIMLSMSRAVGETAPILFIIGSSLVNSWKPLQPATSLPTMMFNYLFNSNYQSQKDACWGIALILIFAVFLLNLASRVIVARTQKGRS